MSVVFLLLLGVVFHVVHGLDILPAQVIHDAGPDGVSEDVCGGPEPVKQPVHLDDERDEVTRQSHGVQHHDHGDQPGLQYTSVTTVPQSPV